ncbi:MAG: hypothetical protein OXU45_08165 [Candidatus Melainabacteria bacterium]|nr:hypothetical protein [Candidatus Melainabacteria bacterium]
MKYQHTIKSPEIVDQLYLDCITYKEGEKKRFDRDQQGRLDFLQRVPCALLVKNNSGKRQLATIKKYATLTRNDQDGGIWLRTSESRNQNPLHYFLGFYDDLIKLEKPQFLSRFKRLLFLAMQPGQRTERRLRNLLDQLATNELDFKTETATISSNRWAHFIKKFPRASQEVFDQCEDLTISDQDVFSFLDALAQTATGPKQIRSALNWLDVFMGSSNENYELQLAAEEMIRPDGMDLGDNFSEEVIRETNRKIMQRMLVK